MIPMLMSFLEHCIKNLLRKIYCWIYYIIVLLSYR